MDDNEPTLGSALVGPVIPVTDLVRARSFYEDVLGLTGQATPDGWRLEAGGGTSIYLIVGVETVDEWPWPLASFRVDDVHASVSALRSRGAVFMTNDELPFDLDHDQVATHDSGMRVAWIRDPDGFVLTLFTPADATSG